MRSTNPKNNSTLVFIGPGPSATGAIFMIHALKQAGFDVYPAFFQKTEDWVGINTIKTLTGHEVLRNSHRPDWTERKATILFSIAWNQPFGLLSDFENSSSSDEVMDFLIKSKSPTLIISEEKANFTDHPLREKIFPYIWSYCQVPTNLFRAIDQTENFFSEIINFFSRRKVAKTKITTAILRSVPQNLTNLAGDKPRWVKNLFETFQRGGLNPYFYENAEFNVAQRQTLELQNLKQNLSNNENQSQDLNSEKSVESHSKQVSDSILNRKESQTKKSIDREQRENTKNLILVETYEGPFEKPGRKKSDFTLTFDPTFASKVENYLMEAHIIFLRFVHGKFFEENLQKFPKNESSFPKTFFATRRENGEVLLFDGQSQRVFPNLIERPANSRLCQFLFEQTETYKA
ncbi:MAG: hypothetical protein HQM08_13230 [Candidatus Riflebacteria bacterium]|nr:hypothetical protein [Candidatus Riflebacteria bacterium]